MPSKKYLSEQDICTRYITPALEQAGWDKMTQIRQEVTFTVGRIVARGKTIKRKESKRADYGDVYTLVGGNKKRPCKI